jgi:hypothetical protein
MSFKCEKCGESQKTRVQPVMITTHVRNATYRIPFVHRDDGKVQIIGDAGRGYEIAKEVKVCPGCASNADEPVVLPESVMRGEELPANARFYEPEDDEYDDRAAA